MTDNKKKSFLESLFAAKKNFTPIIRDKTNAFFNDAPYASLDSVLKSTEPALFAEGIIIQHALKFNDKCQWLETVLVRDDGELSGTSQYVLFSLDDKLPSEHKKGSSHSYAKRRNISSLLNLKDVHDDDGNAASIPDAKNDSKADALGYDPLKHPYRFIADTLEESITEKEVRSILKKHNIKTNKDVIDYGADNAKKLIKESM